MDLFIAISKKQALGDVLCNTRCQVRYTERGVPWYFLVLELTSEVPAVTLALSDYLLPYFLGWIGRGGNSGNAWDCKVEEGR